MRRISSETCFKWCIGFLGVAITAKLILLIMILKEFANERTISY